MAEMQKLMEKREDDIQQQIELLTRLVGEKKLEDVGAREQVKLTKFSEGDDIESYLTMTAYEVPKE